MFYFVFVIFLGPFYLINLVLAVVSLSYEQETAALQDETLRVSPYWNCTPEVFQQHSKPCEVHKFTKSQCCVTTVGFTRPLSISR